MRVLDLTHVLAGPYATYQLALMGAEVIRVERPGGDDFVRGHGGTEAMRAAGFGASFLSQNAGKRSVLLDLKRASGRAVLHRLAARADVVVENFRPGVAARLGASLDALAEVRPGIILASLSGFGASGPLSGRPAYDHILQGLSGMMAMTGTPESGPMRVGFPIVDYVAGQALLAAILAALLRRAAIGAEAQHVEVSMLDAITTLMGAYAIHQQTTGELRGLEGNRAFSDSPFSGRFETADGELVITANTPAQAVRLAGALGRPDLAETAEAARIGEELARVLRTRSAAEWERCLADANVPAARVLSLAECLALPQMAGSPAWREVRVPELDLRVRAPALPIRADWADRPLGRVPGYGADTDAVLAETGYAQAEIAALRAEGVLG